MEDDSSCDNVPTADLLGIQSDKARVRLRRAHPVNRRSKGIVFKENFTVTEDQEAADEELTKQAYHEVESLPQISSTDGISMDTGSKEETESIATVQLPSNLPSLEEIEKEYLDIAKFKIFQLAGDDVMGRPVIAFSACRLPSRDLIDHQRLLQFAKATLDHYVINDYALVYFHFGLSSQNKPSFSWLLQVYKELDRKYKKNIKAFYVVHPSNFIKVAYAIMQPFLSKKFGRKIHNINRLDDLSPYLRLGQLDIPKEVREHDERLIARSRPRPTTATTSSFYIESEKPKTQQFGVSLKTLIENNVADPIPIVIRKCVEFLREHALTTEGIFRRSPLSTTVEEFKRKFNFGEDVHFDPSDVHTPAVLIKKFLREMPEPLLTFDFYDVAVDICSLPHDERIARMRSELKIYLPAENYKLLVYIIRFLEEVVQNCAENKMSTGNLAIIFGPNLMWSKFDTTSLTSMAKTNTFTKLLLDHSQEVFTPDVFVDKN